MARYIKLIVGVMLMFASVAGSVSLFTGGAEEAVKRIVENGVDTMGVVERRTKHTVAARWGRVPAMGFYYSMDYSFATEDGTRYSDQLNISKEQAYALNDGTPIRVRYNKRQPGINSPTDFEEYMTADHVNNIPYGTILFSSVLMLFAGLYLVWSSGVRLPVGRTSMPRAKAYKAAIQTRVSPDRIKRFTAG